jgi:hypothetical protein
MDSQKKCLERTEFNHEKSDEPHTMTVPATLATKSACRFLGIG